MQCESATVVLTALLPVDTAPPPHSGVSRQSDRRRSEAAANEPHVELVEVALRIEFQGDLGHADTYDPSVDVHEAAARLEIGAIALKARHVAGGPAKCGQADRYDGDEPDEQGLIVDGGARVKQPEAPNEPDRPATCGSLVAPTMAREFAVKVDAAGSAKR